MLWISAGVASIKTAEKPAWDVRDEWCAEHVGPAILVGFEHGSIRKSSESENFSDATREYSIRYVMSTDMALQDARGAVPNFNPPLEMNVPVCRAISRSQIFRSCVKSVPHCQTINCNQTFQLDSTTVRIFRNLNEDEGVQPSVQQ